MNGKQYGVPYDLHTVGFWYRKDLFAKAGITTPPTTLAALESDDTKLKAAHIVPIAVGSKDKWPDAFWWEYFALRECPTATLKAAMKSVNLSASCFMQAGNQLKTFMSTKPFQAGFLGTPSQVGAGSSAGMVANGKAAMELQGDWDPGVMAPLTSDKKLNSELGWFPFPAITGGAGARHDHAGRRRRLLLHDCGRRAGLRRVPEVHRQHAGAEEGGRRRTSGLPANPAAASALSLPR